MKNLFVLILLAVSILCTNTSAQTELTVSPGFGTLNDAIAANKGNVIYKLKAGGWYGLNAVIENTDFPLTIIGEIPSSKDSMYAMVQIGSDGTGIPFENMFNIFNNLTLKNIFIVDANENNVQSASSLILMQSTCRVVIDNVVIDPLSTNNGLVNCQNNQKPSIFLTNSQIIRSGQQVHANDGNLFVINTTRDGSNNGFDTLYIENNSFISTGTWFIRNNNTATGQDNFIWINHNTFVSHKSQLDLSWFENEYFLTNNLFFDLNTQPWNQGWNNFYPDGNIVVGGWNSRLALVTADTLQDEILPSSRKNFVQYNLWYLNPDIAALPAWGETHTLNYDGVTPLPRAYLMDLYYPKDSAIVNREVNMFGSPDFPNFKAGNTLEIDPHFTQSKIYDLSDSLAAWTFPAMLLTTFKFDPALIQPVAEWTKFWWNADEDGLGNPTAWPRFDGTYSNQDALTGSIEKLPLGDLNWYPEAKAKWEANKEQIQEHILSMNTSQIVLTDIESLKFEIPLSYNLSQNYPNPFNPSTTIKFSIPKSGNVSLKVYNLLGQVVTTLIEKELHAGYHQIKFEASNLTSGIYFYRLEANDFVITKKMILMK